MHKKLISAIVVIIIVSIGISLIMQKKHTNPKLSTSSKNSTNSQSTHTAKHNAVQHTNKVASVHSKDHGLTKNTEEISQPEQVPQTISTPDIPPAVISEENNSPKKQTNKRPSLPPDIDKPDIPPTILEQINGFVEESKYTAGPEAGQLGEQLLNSTNPILQVAGVAVLAENNLLSEDIIKQISEADDLSIPLNSLGWLRDTGHLEYADLLNSALGTRNITTEDTLDLMGSDRLNSSGARIMLDVISNKLSPEEVKDVFQDISSDKSYEYSIRMKALLKLREKMPFEEFRETVNKIKNETSQDDDLWQEGISRLAEKLAGPVAVHTGPPTLTPDNIDEMLAREYPMTLEDLAQQLEYITDNDDAYIQQGTAKKLQKELQELKKRPWTENQQISLARIESIAQYMAELEKPATDAPPNTPTPPPGPVQENNKL